MKDKFKLIKYIISDIDGVLTDGRFVMDSNGNELKQLCYRDLDSIGIGRKAGIEFFFLTGEKGKMVKTISERFKVPKYVEDAKDKLTAIEELCKKEKLDPRNVCYIGDSDRDVSAIVFASLGVAPCDATPKAISSADYITKTNGGFGVLFEVVNLVIASRIDIVEDVKL